MVQMADGWIEGGANDAFAYKKKFDSFSFEIPRDESFMKTLIMIWTVHWLDPQNVATCFTYEPLIELADKIAEEVLAIPAPTDPNDPPPSPLPAIARALGVQGFSAKPRKRAQPKEKNSD